MNGISSANCRRLREYAPYTSSLYQSILLIGHARFYLATSDRYDVPPSRGVFYLAARTRDATTALLICSPRRLSSRTSASKSGYRRGTEGNTHLSGHNAKAHHSHNSFPARERIEQQRHSTFRPSRGWRLARMRHSESLVTVLWNVKGFSCSSWCCCCCCCCCEDSLGSVSICPSSLEESSSMFV